MPLGRHATVVVLGTAQTLAWASTYYLPAMLASAMAADLGVATPTVFAAFSVALVVSAFIGPRAGDAIDRWGGRPVLMATSLTFALGLAGLALARDVYGLFGAWLILGMGMGSGLYEAAFATLVRLYRHQARGPITGITLIAGFASTVGWPLSAWLEATYGWRSACFVWAGLHLLVGLPLHWLLPRLSSNVEGPSGDSVDAEAATSEGEGARSHQLQATLLLSFVFAATWFISTAMAAHLPALLQAGGVSLASAVFVGTLIGPAQVGARLLEFGLLRSSVRCGRPASLPCFIRWGRPCLRSLGARPLRRSACCMVRATAF